MNDQQHAQRGRMAGELLENEIFVEAFGAVRARLVTIMESAKTDEATLRAKLALGLLADVKQHVEMVAKNGAVAAESIKLERAREQALQKRQWWKVVGT